jgi:phosphonoacetaldehyde hydrolase
MSQRLQAVIFDWAGTTVDYGCFAPVAVFVHIFQRRGVSISIAQARAPMGLEKRDHIRAIAQTAEVTASWEAAQGKPWSEDDIDALYRDSVMVQKSSVMDYASLIPGTLEAVADCRQRGLKIGSTTGYSRIVMDALLPAAAARGYAPDALVVPDDVPAGRPAPYMIYSNLMQLEVYPLAAVVKVGDTLPDIAEGLNAGTWTVALTQTGNQLGLSEAEVKALSDSELAAKLAPIEQQMRQAGAHEVIRSIAELPQALDRIDARLQAGERPV